MDTAYGPPTDVLGQTVPVHQLAVRTDRAVVAVQHVVAFSQGCLIVLHLAARRGSLSTSDWERLQGSHLGADPEIAAADAASLTFGVRFPDGTNATTTEHPGRNPSRLAGRPEPPMLVETDTDSSSDDEVYRSNQRLWLWPLPPPGPFEFVVEWRGMGIAPTAITLDGDAIVRAAPHALPLWAS
ncbi:hypothetical protein [Actinoplanes sp. NPDC020271]|uniref:hypothetical protein n=1 Tax=Actinoplanes sp. NPDC020271 TaxID=3363896 RepID=UPI00378DAAFA